MLVPSPPALGDETPPVKIYAGKLFDSVKLELLEHQIITVSPCSGLVLDVSPFSGDTLSNVTWDDPQVVDLRHATVLPGLVDVHVHCKPLVLW